MEGCGELEVGLCIYWILCPPLVLSLFFVLFLSFGRLPFVYMLYDLEGTALSL
jgi:hypothetical protein